MKDKDKAKELTEEITQRKKAEKTSRGAEQEKTAILNSLSEHVVFQDLEHRIIWTNKAAAESVDLADEQLVGRYCYEIWPQRNEPCVGCPLAKAREAGKPQEAEITTPDGRVWFIRGYPVRDANENLVGMAEVTLEITRHKKAEEKLREVEAFRSGLLANSPTPIAVVDADSMVRYVNPAMVRLTGFSAEELTGEKAPYSYWPKEDHFKIMKSFRKAMRQGGERVVELFQKKNGEKFRVEITSVVVKKNGKFQYLLSNWVDITERKKAEEALKESEHYLRKAQQTAHFGSWVLDVKTNRVEFSDEMFNIFGITKEQFTGALEYTNKLVVPKDRARVQERYKDLLIRRKPVSMEYSITRPDGSMRHLWGNGDVELDEKGNLQRLVGTVLDITERQRAEEELQTIIKTALDGFWLTNLEGKILEVNDSYCRMVGYKREELLKMSISDLEAIESPEEVAGHIKTVIEQGYGSFESRHKRKDGKIIDVEISVNYLDVGEGQLFVFARDITERKKAEDALRESEARYRAVIEGAQDMIQSVGFDGSIIFVNKSWLDTLGYAEAELSDLNFFEIVHPDSQAHCREIISEVAKGKPIHSLEAAFLTKDGRKILVEGNAAPRYIGSKVVAAHCVLRDITERRQISEALRESEEKFSKAFRSSPNAMAISTFKDGKFLEVNDGFLRLNGVSREEVIGRTSKELGIWVNPKDRVRILRIMRERGRVVDEEYKSRTKSGEILTMLFSAEPIDIAGERCILSAAADITERKQAEDTLRESEEKFYKAFHATSNLMAIASLKTGKIIDVNEAYARLVGYKREEIIGQTELALDLSIAQEQREEIEKRLREKGTVHDFELEILTKSGGIRTVLFSADTITLKGEPCLINTAIDITDRKRAEQLQRGENYVLTLLGRGAKLSKLLDAIVRLGEQNDPSIKGSVLLFDPSKSSELLLQASGSSLPDDYKVMLEAGIPIGPKSGCCGTAAHRKERVIIPDIAKSPLYKPFEAVVKRTIKNNLLAVWSQPIMASDGELLGTIANYSSRVGEPSADNLRVLEWSARIAAIAIERKRAEEALMESEAFQSSLLANSPIPVSVINPDSSVRFVNPAMVKLTGFSAAELTGEKAPYCYWPKEESAKIMKRFKKAMRQGGERVLELFQKKNGDKFWVEITSVAVKKDGKFQYLLVSWVDITERKLAEEKLRDEATRHRILIDESSDGIVILDEKGNVYEANRRFAEMLGYTPEEVRKLNVWDWEADYPREQVAEMIASVGPEGDHFETQHRRKDGTVFDVEISTNGAVYAGQKLIFCVCRDITERKQAEAALKESEEKYKTLVEATSDVIWEVDTEGRFSFISPKIRDILGYEVDEVVGKKRTLDLIAKREKRKWLKRFKELNAKREPFFGLEITHVHKNGRRVICETSGIPLFDSAGEFKGFVGIDKDITERRQMQEQLVITDRLASVGELAAGIAHELNNPLTGVIGFSQLLMDREMPDDVREDLQAVYSEAQRASQVVKNLLTFARKHTAAKEKVNINDIINKVLELRAYEQNLENIKVDARLDSELPKAMADYFQLQQVFLNIVINAEYFMKEAHNKGTLTITTEEVGNKVKASFADDGPGIAKDDLGHLFDPFFTTKEVGKGTGLGLSICHGIITEHGGRIYAESELGKGATFIVELPIGAAEDKGSVA